VDALALHDLVHLMPEGPPGVTLAVETGARSSTINVSDADRLRLTRSVGLGGQQLTLAIRDDLGVSAEEAQRLKETEGLALLERAPRPHRIAAWLENFRGELRRSSLSFGPTAVSRIFLAGAGSEIPGLAEVIRAEFGLEPARLSVRQLFPHALIRATSDQAADRCLLAIAQALRGTGQSAWTISLVPREVAEVRQARLVRTVGAAAAVLVAAALVTGYILEARTVKQREARLVLLRNQAELADRQEAVAKKVLDERDLLRKDLEIVQPAEVRRHAALELLRTISEAAPTGVILTHFTLRPGQPLQIQGTAPGSGTVADLQAGMARSRLVTSVSLDRADQVSVTRSVPTTGPVSMASAGELPRTAGNRQPVRSQQRRTKPRTTPGAPPPVTMAQKTTREVSFTFTVHLWIEQQTAKSPAAVPVGVPR